MSDQLAAPMLADCGLAGMNGRMAPEKIRNADAGLLQWCLSVLTLGLIPRPEPEPELEAG